MASGKATNPAEVDNGMDMESGAVQAPPASRFKDMESGAVPASRFKGVVPQPNGRWGAQIYERHSRRVWLGTFADEGAAARAYDVAALRFRGRGRSCTSGPELAFLADHSKAEVVDMLRKHTYADELQQGLRRGRGRAQPTPAWEREFLFDKAVTPSDVGKLNRLVVRKQHAEKHFPLMAPTGKGVLLNFEDGQGKAWRFRYSYWHSSQSYVLTNGWSRFVREKGLRAGDTVTFSRSAPAPAPYGDTHEQLLIDYKKNEDAGHVAVRLFGVEPSTSPEEGSGCRDHRLGKLLAFLPYVVD